MAKQKNSSSPLSDQTDWLAVIGRCLAYLSLRQAQQERPRDFENVLDKVNFLERFGVPLEDAAHAAGSTLNSVQVMRSRKKGAAGGKEKR